MRAVLAGSNCSGFAARARADSRPPSTDPYAHPARLAHLLAKWRRVQFIAVASGVDRTVSPAKKRYSPAEPSATIGCIARDLRAVPCAAPGARKRTPPRVPQSVLRRRTLNLRTAFLIDGRSVQTCRPVRVLMCQRRIVRRGTLPLAQALQCFTNIPGRALVYLDPQPKTIPLSSRKLATGYCCCRNRRIGSYLQNGCRDNLPGQAARRHDC